MGELGFKLSLGPLFLFFSTCGFLSEYVISPELICSWHRPLVGLKHVVPTLSYCVYAPCSLLDLTRHVTHFWKCVWKNCLDLGEVLPSEFHFSGIVSSIIIQDTSNLKLVVVVCCCCQEERRSTCDSPVFINYQHRESRSEGSEQHRHLTWSFHLLSRVFAH